MLIVVLLVKLVKYLTLQEMPEKKKAIVIAVAVASTVIIILIKFHDVFIAPQVLLLLKIC